MVNLDDLPNLRWSELKAELRSTWERLTDAELEETGGDPGALGQLIARRYGCPAPTCGIAWSR